MPRAEALELMKDEPYKVELINDLPEDATISFYKQGDFVDLCAGPHVNYTSKVKAYKLLSATGAYWRGNEKNKMLQRIYGTAFLNKADLEAHLEQLEEAKKRDHNKLGRELELFTTVDYIGQGLPIMLPKGARVIQLLQRWVEDEEQKTWLAAYKDTSNGKTTCIKFQVTGITIKKVCLYLAMKKRIRKYLHFVR